MKLLMLFRRNRAAAGLDDEIQYHLDRQIVENISTGMSADEARAAALRSFGNPALLRDETRATWSWNWLEAFWRDVRIGVRTLLRTPSFSLVAVGVMAVCIGAATSLFTIVRSVLLRPLPFRDPEKLVMVYEHFRDPKMNQQEFNYNVVSPGDFYDWQAQTHGFEEMAAWRYWQFNMTGERGELPEVVQARGGSWNLFSLLGVSPVYGRTFTADEDRPGQAVVMLTWSMFKRRFGGDPSIVGRQIHLDSKPYTVVGVLPAWFTYPDARVQVWVPYAVAIPPEILKHHDFHFSRVVARLRPDVSLANAISQVEAVQYQLHLQHLNEPVAEDVVPRALNDDLAKYVKKPLSILMCAVACMLLIGCLNVANLLVARGAARQKEVAIRGALGAQRTTLIREQLTESLLICLAGGAAGLLLSMAATQWLAVHWKDLPSAQSIRVDGTVLAFVSALVFAATLLAGVLPALSSTGKRVFAVLQAASRTAGTSLSRAALRKVLLIIEIAATVVLLVSAGLLLKSFVHLRTTNIGSVTDNVLTLRYGLPPKKYDKPEKVNAFNEALLERLRTMPGVQAVALGSEIPGAGYGGDDVFTIREHPPLEPGASQPDALTRIVDPGYFSALQIPLLSGRFFTGQDRAGQPNRIIINRELARQYLPGEEPIGKHLNIPADGNSGPNHDYEVIGVVGDTLWQVGQPVLPTFYFSALAKNQDTNWTLAVRTVSDPLAISIPVQKQIAALDSELPVSDVLTMQQVIGESLGNASFSTTLVLAFAVLSLLLASVGLYGVLSYLVAQRTVEIGIRIAMGASREHVLRLSLLDGLRPAFFGLGLGIAVSAATAKLIQHYAESMLYRTQPFDPLVFSAVAAVLVLVAAIACLIPAWRASRLDPMQALRTE
jgi:putative ABC transport system permease protein